MSRENPYEPSKHQSAGSDLSAAHAIKDEIRGVMIFIAVIWVFYLLDCVLPISDKFALVPRSLSGLPGIPLMPFMHGGWMHLIGNTIPLFVLLVLLAGSKARSWEIVTALIVASGCLVWVFGGASGPNGTVTGHVGASGLIYALTGYLVASGVFEKRPIPLGVSVIVGLMFGLSTFKGLIPTQGVSWSGHFFGLVAGVGIAYILTRGDSATSDNTRLPKQA